MNKETILRTLELPQQYEVMIGQRLNKMINRKLVITKYVDHTKSLKTINAKGRVEWVNAPDRYEYGIEETVDLLNDAKTYATNQAFFDAHSSKDTYFDAENPLIIHKDHKQVVIQANDYGNAWFERTKVQYFINEDGLLQRESQDELGVGSTIRKTFVKRENGVDIYANPKDYLGREITGEDVPNQGAPSYVMKLTPETTVEHIKLITKTTAGSGMWSSSNPVWSGGVKEYTSNTTTYMPINDVLEFFGKTREELEWDLRRTAICEKISEDTHILSTSSELLIENIDEDTIKVKGIVYYSGEDVQVKRPTGKITSYNKPFPGIIFRWRLHQWGPDGWPISNNTATGATWTLQLDEAVNNGLTIKRGTSHNWNASTKTLTIDKSRPTDFWFSWEEKGPAYKTWGGENIRTLAELFTIADNENPKVEILAQGVIQELNNNKEDIIQVSAILANYAN